MMEFNNVIKRLMEEGMCLSITKQLNMCHIVVYKIVHENEGKRKVVQEEQVLPLDDHIDRRTIDTINFCIDKIQTS